MSESNKFGLVNKNGLTFARWLNAAFFGSKYNGMSMYAKLHSSDQMMLRKAWNIGEDPAEHCIDEKNKE